jgi:hypothetical protein
MPRTPWGNWFAQHRRTIRIAEALQGKPNKRVEILCQLLLEIDDGRVIVHDMVPSATRFPCKSAREIVRAYENCSIQHGAGKTRHAPDGFNASSGPKLPDPWLGLVTAKARHDAGMV